MSVKKNPMRCGIYTYGIKNQRSRESDMGDKLHYNCVCRRPSPAVCQMLGMNYEELDLVITSTKFEIRKRTQNTRRKPIRKYHFSEKASILASTESTSPVSVGEAVVTVAHYKSSCCKITEPSLIPEKTPDIIRHLHYHET